MTEVEKYEDPSRAGSSIELAPQAWGLAQKIARTEFVPSGLRGKPEAVLACMLYGREAGVGEMNALAKIHVVDGRPGMSAELMRALVFQHGHEIHVEETSSTRCVVIGKRRDSERETRVVWTLDDAKRAGLAARDNWKKYPDAMLLARATAKLCRAVFPDVLAGLSYTPEELEEGAFAEEVLEGRLVDQGSEEAAAAPAAPARPRARARRAATRGSDAPEKTEPDPAPKPEAEAPPLPGEEDDDVVDAEIVDDEPEEPEESPSEDVEEPEDAEVVDTDEDAFPDDHEGDDETIEGSGPSYTGPQVIAIRLGELGVKDRAKKLSVVNALLGLEGDDAVESSKELEPAEVSKVLDALKAYGPGDWIPGLPAEDFDDEPAPEPEAEAEEKPPTRRRKTPGPEEWTVDRWRDFLKDRKVKVSELVKEANRIGRERELENVPGSLDDVPGSGIAAELVGFVEDLALERGDS